MNKLHYFFAFYVFEVSERLRSLLSISSSFACLWIILTLISFPTLTKNQTFQNVFLLFFTSPSGMGCPATYDMSSVVFPFHCFVSCYKPRCSIMILCCVLAINCSWLFKRYANLGVQLHLPSCTDTTSAWSSHLLLPDHCDLPTSTNPDSIGEHGMLTKALLFTLRKPVMPLNLPWNITLMFLDAW